VSNPYQRISTPVESPCVIPAKAGIQCLGMDSGSPFYSARNDRGRGGRHPIPISAFPRPSNPPTVIPAKAGIQYPSMDSGSPFHYARNDAERGDWYLFPISAFPAHRIPPPSFPRKRESSTSAWIPGLRFTPPGMTGGEVVGIQSRSAHSHARRTLPHRHSRESGNPVPRHGFRVSVSLRPE